MLVPSALLPFAAQEGIAQRASKSLTSTQDVSQNPATASTAGAEVGGATAPFLSEASITRGMLLLPAPDWPLGRTLGLGVG